MPPITAAQALQNYIDQIQAWTGRTSFVAQVVKGPGPASELLLKASNLTVGSPASDFDAIVVALQALKRRTNLFTNAMPYSYMFARSFAAKSCATALANSEILLTDQVRPFRVMSADFELQGRSSYFFEGSPTPEEKFAYIDFSKVQESELEDGLINASTDFPFRFLSTLTVRGGIPNLRALFVDSTIDIPKERANSFAQMALARDSQAFHSPAAYTGASVVKALFYANPLVKLEQFDDVLQVLSEANSDHDILDKFLRLYQVLENFMVRRQVIGVLRGGGGGNFSIRSFRQLYRAVETTEEEALSTLIKTTLISIANPLGTKSLIRHICDRWTPCLGAAADIPNTEAALLEVFGPFPKNGPGSFNSAMFLASLANTQQSVLGTLIYRFRNSIVHNKEHEFHLTHLNLSIPMHRILNEFLIPAMEDIIYALLLVDRRIVWYDSATIRLYME
jgi:hypothetical protein